jgi:ATP-dependent DNA helicase RecG
MPAKRLRVFVSSVQPEFKQVRRNLKAFLLGDAVLRRFVADVFLFEELPARDQRPDDVYLDELACSDIYLGILGYEYGSEDNQGVSPTEREYDHATKLRKPRFIYVWGTDDKKRAPKMRSLVRKASAELIRRRIRDASALTAEVYASLVDYLDRAGILRTPPFDTAGCEHASLTNIAGKRVAWFLGTARRERGFPLGPSTATQAVLTHLNLLDGRRPTNAAILLFAGNPQRFHPAAQTRCVHCHGTAYQRPFASMQVYAGDIFEQADQARDFVLAKISRGIGTRAAGITAPASYELPPDAVAEAVINAIVHRDYHSNASVEVRLFADRLEVWNPGGLPGTLTLQSLRGHHASVPNNPMLAESFYLTRYIERAGSGTLAMIELCRRAGLPEPDFEIRQGFFVATLWRDWLTTNALAGFQLNDRQSRAVVYLKRQRIITNSTYQSELKASKRTATRDLDDLVAKGLLEKVGTTGKGVHYRLGKGAIKGPKGP